MARLPWPVRTSLSVPTTAASANRCDFHLEQELARAETQDMRADLDVQNKRGCANSDFEFACDKNRAVENYFLCCRGFRVVTDEPTVIFAWSIRVLQGMQIHL
jgi:hypothetical protein